MHADILHVKGLTFTGRSNTNHWVMMDTTEDIGGHGGGTRPLELVLVALGGCTGMDVVSILEKMKQGYTRFELSLEAEIAKEHPKVFKKIHLVYTFLGDGIEGDKVEKAIKLSQDKYCPVSHMLKPTVEITHEYRILPSGE